MGVSYHDANGGAAWRLPPESQPPLVGELVERIDEALATARSSEAAVMTVGAAALDAAEQAKRAADLAERASAALSRPPAPAGGGVGGGRVGLVDRPPPIPARDAMERFSARAERVAERLERLQRVPSPPPETW
jgi:hypothetical protein